jgi:hypothetical protein
VRSHRKGLKIGILILAVAFLLAQAIRIEESNPPVSSDLSCDPLVKSLLHRACYNCHSNETVWPWYSNIAPVSWLVASDVREARQHMNFSEWGTYDSDTRFYKLKGIAEEIEEGGMPLWYYSIVHKEARLNSAERDRIVGWAVAALESAAPKH